MVSVQDCANEWKHYICRQAGVSALISLTQLSSEANITMERFAIKSLSMCFDYLLWLLSLIPLSLPLIEKTHLIMQRPSCRISKVIDVIRLLTSAGSHAQNIKEGLTHKWAAYCCVGLVIALLRASASDCESALCSITYVSNICCCRTKFRGQGLSKCDLLLEKHHEYIKVPMPAYAYSYFCRIC